MVLAALIVFGVATAASAAPWKDGAHGKKWKFKEPGTVKINVQLVDINSHWAEKSIRSMASWGMISGYPDFTFRPNTTVSKYEALMMIARASGYEADKNLSWNDSLEDMTDYAVDEGILTKDESEDLAGWQPAKRYEVAVWAVRAMGLEEDDDKLFFNDINEIPAYARSCVSSMYRYQYMVGYPGKVFAPNKPVTRAELAAIIYRILDEGPIDDDDSDDSDSNEEVEISSLDPADGSDNVEIDINRLTAKFNVEIEAVDALNDVKEGIEIENEDGEVVDIDQVSIDGRYLEIELAEELEEDTTYKVTIEDDIIKAEDSDEVFEGLSGSQWEFTTGDEDDVEQVKIENLDPENGEEDVDREDTNVLRATFNCDIEAHSLVDAVVVYNKDNDKEVAIDMVEIDGDELVITLEEELDSNDTYEVTIKDGYLESEESGEEFEGLDGEDWSFTTRE
ncbi:MAG: Ig-like domain-containing protein [Actinobacteria bacterium]|nr:Ig-like domain-containing protein [Actinomycetota bacterium]